MAPSDRPRLAVLVSGGGTNLQAIIDAIADGRLNAEIAVVISNNPAAHGLQRAKAAGIRTLVRPHKGVDRETYDSELAYTVSTFGVDLVVLAGWLRLLTTYFVAHHRTINLHPAKPGTFPGLHAIERAFAAWEAGEIDHGGVMVHYVPDEGVDDGPVIAWEPVPFEPDDTLDTYEARVHDVEHRLLVSAIASVVSTSPRTGGWS